MFACHRRVRVPPSRSRPCGRSHKASWTSPLSRAESPSARLEHFPRAPDQGRMPERSKIVIYDLKLVKKFTTSDFDFGAKLNNAIRGDAEELGRTRRNAGQPCIETLAPSCHPWARGRFDV